MSGGGVRNTEPVDRIVEELLVASAGNRLAELFKALDAVADQAWWPRDVDYAAEALHQAALGADTPSRRNRLLRHAIGRAEQYARWASCTAEHDARLHHAREIGAALVPQG